MRNKDILSVAGFLLFLAFVIPITISSYTERKENECQGAKGEEHTPIPLPDYHNIGSRVNDETDIETLEYDTYSLSWDKKRNVPVLCSFWINRDSRSDVYFYWSLTNDERCASATWDASKFPYDVNVTNETIVPLAPKSIIYQSNEAEYATLAIPMSRDMWVEWEQICKTLFEHITKLDENFAVSVGPIFSKLAEKINGRPVATSFFIAIYGIRDIYPEGEVPSSFAVLLTRNKTTNKPEFKYATILEIEKRAHVTLFQGLMDDADKGKMQKENFALYGDKPLTTFEFAEWQAEERRRQKMAAMNMGYTPPKKDEKEPLTGTMTCYSEAEKEWRRKNGLPYSETKVEVNNWKGILKDNHRP